jgi:uncharacterized linocin/CFP29 family protein
MRRPKLVELFKNYESGQFSDVSRLETVLQENGVQGNHKVIINKHIYVSNKSFIFFGKVRKQCTKNNSCD